MLFDQSHYEVEYDGPGGEPEEGVDAGFDFVEVVAEVFDHAAGEELVGGARALVDGGGGATASAGEGRWLGRHLVFLSFSFGFGGKERPLTPNPSPHASGERELLIRT
jgi:hypothetical protein